MALAIDHFELKLNLIGARDGERSKTFEILSSGVDDATRVTNARSARDAIVTAFKTVSSAWVLGTRLTEVQYEGTAVPTFPRNDAAAYDGAGNMYEEATITIGLDVGGGKQHTMRIPAPADGIFAGDSGNSNVIDPADSNLLAFLALFANDGSALGAVSDGEQYESPVNITDTSLKSVGSGKDY